MHVHVRMYISTFLHRSNARHGSIKYEELSLPYSKSDGYMWWKVLTFKTFSYSMHRWICILNNMLIVSRKNGPNGGKIFWHIADDCDELRMHDSGNQTVRLKEIGITAWERRESITWNNEYNMHNLYGDSQ